MVEPLVYNTLKIDNNDHLYNRFKINIFPVIPY